MFPVSNGRFLEDGVHADIPKDDIHADDAEEARTAFGGRCVARKSMDVQAEKHDSVNVYV